MWKKFGDDQAGNLAALVACYAFASIFPLPRSLAAPPHTAEDVRAYQLYAEAEARKKDETVSVTVPGPLDDENDEKMPVGSPATTRTEPETSAASGPQARGEDPHDPGDDR